MTTRSEVQNMPLAKGANTAPSGGLSSPSASTEYGQH